MKHVLFDCDVLMDVLCQRQPFFSAAAAALDAAGRGEVIGYVSAHSVTNLFYLLRKQVGAGVARATLSTLLQVLRVASVTEAVIQAALTSGFRDFEDAVSHSAAVAAGVDEIVTRNVADYTAATLRITLPAHFKSSE